jgi:UDP-N-acetylglucosamine--N-acetylmuramyl-(pentapeptide) pyrophosphoryl-undecaprenol N-acetylglucosamine transferase
MEGEKKQKNIQTKSSSNRETGHNMNKKIIIAGGGTGGHIFPAIAIANALMKAAPGMEILFIGAKGKMEMEKVPQAGFKIKGIDIAGFNRSSLIKNIGLPWKIVKSFIQVKGIISSFKPDAVIGVGGYSSFPVLRYAQLRKIPTFIHESNSFAGKSNMLLGKKATWIFAASDGMEKFFPPDKIILTGNPVRSDIVNNSVTREEAIRFFGLDPSKKTVLSIGGSLGAKGINEAIDMNLETFERDGIQLIWQTGKTFGDKAKEHAKGRNNIWVNDFITQMNMAFSAADIVVSRSGAMSIAELCVTAKPAIFVPFPFASENHQTANALNLELKNAGIMIKDQEAKDKLVPALISLVQDEKRQKELSQNISKMAVKNADERIAAEILKVIN